MSQEDIDSLMLQAEKNYFAAAAELKRVAELKSGTELTDDDLSTVAGGGNTVCIACVITSPICSPGSAIASIGG
jgi:hypothetical protein